MAKIPLPIPDADAKLGPSDFASILGILPESCVLIGGQAVAWWEQRYDCQGSEPVHSRDIDFWGDREGVKTLAKRLNVPPYWPHKYDMTVLVGALALKIGETRSSIEVLHTVPGLDHTDPETVATSAAIEGIEHPFRILTPVSLLLVKLHALRHFSQEDRNDLKHLTTCVQTSRFFITEILGNSKAAIWNCNRVLHASTLKPYQRLSQEHGFDLLQAIPKVEIQAASEDPENTDADRLKKFLQLQLSRYRT